MTPVAPTLDLPAERATGSGGSSVEDPSVGGTASAPATSGNSDEDPSDPWHTWNYNRQSPPMTSVPEAATLPPPAATGAPQPQFSTVGMPQVQGPTFYRDPRGHLVNEHGERVDALGRLTRARGVQGSGSHRRWLEKWHWRDRN
jgi:hypothetical protein